MLQHANLPSHVGDFDTNANRKEGINLATMDIDKNFMRITKRYRNDN